MYKKLQLEGPKLSKHLRLALAVHAVNNTAGPDGITPSILVFGTVPRIPLPDSASMPLEQKDRLEAMQVARKEMETITAQRRIAQALKHRHGMRPHPPYQFGDQVRIWREELKRFTGPFTVHGYDNEKTVWVMTDKIRPFSTSVVRLIPEEENDDVEKDNEKSKSFSRMKKIPKEIDETLANAQGESDKIVSTDSVLFTSISNAFLSESCSKKTF